MTTLRCTLYRYWLPALLLLLVIKGAGYAQTGTLNTTAAPVSPTAAALGKYVEIPVGHYSGIPNISVPLYSLNVKGITIPISLSYHASGVKVKEIPGPTGIGWSLNAGGVITRIVRGHPDTHDPYVSSYDSDDYYDSLNKRRVVNAYFGNYTSEFNLNERYNMCLSAPGVVADNAVRSIPYPTPSYHIHYFTRMDTEIDLYYFNFLGHTGQFTFTNDGKPMLLSTTDMKIESYERIFKLTDGQGIEYFFEEKEQALDESSNVQYYAGGGRMHTTSWYLSKIYIPHNNQTVSFSYSLHWNYDLYYSGMYSDYAEAFSSRVDRLKYLHGTIANYQYGNGFYGCPTYDRDYASTGPHYYSNNLFLNEINWGDNKIKFYGNTNRTDLYKYKYDSIKVFAGNVQVKKIDFKYNYFNSASPHPGYKKLKLDSVLIGDQKYSFSYIDSLHGKELPPINGKGQDMWGYYNGESDETGIPYYKIFDEPNPDPNFFHGLYDVSGSAAKNPDYKYAQIGTLNSITYPTGGKTFFEYEGNDYSYYPFVDPTKTIETDPYTQFKFDSTSGKGCSTFTNPLYTTSQQSKEREFVLHKDQTVTAHILMGQQPFTTLTAYRDSVYFFTAQATVCLKKYNDTTRQFVTVACYQLSPRDSIGLPANQWDYDQVKYKAFTNTTKSLTLTEGRYKITANASGWYMSADLGIAAIFPYKKKPRIYNAGGIRIKKIQFFANTDSDTSYVKHYDYRSSDTLSNGVLESPFANMSTSSYCGYYRAWSEGQFLDFAIQEACGFFNLTSDPVIPLGNSQGGVIGYSKVTERREDSSKIIYQFTNGQQNASAFADEFTNSPTYPTRIRIKVDNSWKRGLAKQTDFYNASGTLMKQQFVDYTYDNSTVNNRSISLALDNVYLYPGGQFSAFNGYYAQPFYSIRGNQNALKTRDSVIVYEGGSSITDVTKYEYLAASNPHSYPVTITNFNSNGEQIITRIKYPQDYTVGTTPSNATAITIKKLLDQHVVAPYIEKYIEKKDAGGANTRVISGQYVRYKPSVPLPDTVFNLQLISGLTNFVPATITGSSASKDSRYRGAINFHKYNKYGDVVEQLQQKNVKEVLVWGYKHQYIVAKVVNSDSATVMALVDTSILNNPTSEEQMQRELKKIRTGLQNSTALVSTYTWAPLIGVLSETDPSGKTIYYSYDVQGRLALVRDQDNKVLKKICYNYQGQPQNCSWYSNQQKSKIFRRSNCTGDSTGRDTTYVVAAGTYYASTQAAADSLATADINLNGQAFANSKGRCELLKFYSQRVYGDFYSELCDWPDAQPYYVDIKDSTFISYISQEDANNHAWWAAQDSANLHGECIHFVDLLFTSYTTAAYNYDVILTNTDTYEQYYFSCFYGSGLLGSVPEGTYNVEFSGYDPWNTHTMRAGCYSWNYSVTTTTYSYNVYLYNIPFSDECNQLSIDYVYY